jgi:hypothetical protein
MQEYVITLQDYCAIYRALWQSKNRLEKQAQQSGLDVAAVADLADVRRALDQLKKAK